MNAEEAVRLARLAAAAGLPKWVKLEIHPDPRYLLPDPVETFKAAEILVKEGFTVLPYINADPVLAKRLQDAGCATVMPLGSPIGSNRGIQTRDQIRIIIEQATVPVVVDAGLGAPSHAAEAMEMGADAVLVNTAIAVSSDPNRMAIAFKMAVEAGRAAYETGLGAQTRNRQRHESVDGVSGLIKRTNVGTKTQEFYRTDKSNFRHRGGFPQKTKRCRARSHIRRSQPLFLPTIYFRSPNRFLCVKCSETFASNRHGIRVAGRRQLEMYVRSITIVAAVFVMSTVAGFAQAWTKGSQGSTVYTIPSSPTQKPPPAAQTPPPAQNQGQQAPSEDLTEGSQSLPASNLYADVNFGGAYQQNSTVETTVFSGTPPATTTSQKTSFNLGVRGDVALGYNFNRSWAAEFNTGLVWNSSGNSQPYPANVTHRHLYSSHPVERRLPDSVQRALVFLCGNRGRRSGLHSFLQRQWI